MTKDVSRTGSRVALPTLLGTGDLEERWGYTRAGVHRLVNDDDFPVPVAAINRGRVKVWSEEQIRAFEAERPKLREVRDERSSKQRATESEGMDRTVEVPDPDPSEHAVAATKTSRSGEPKRSSRPRKVHRSRYTKAAREEAALADSGTDTTPERPTEPAPEGTEHDGYTMHEGRWQSAVEMDVIRADREAEASMERMRDELARELIAEGEQVWWDLAYRFPQAPPAVVRNRLKGDGWRYERRRDEWRARLDTKVREAWEREFAAHGGIEVYAVPDIDRRFMLTEEGVLEHDGTEYRKRRARRAKPGSRARTKRTRSERTDRTR